MRKKIGGFLVVFSLLWGTAAAAGITINKMEYSEHDGYIQLFLPTTQIMPVPETYYPEKGNSQKLVMRIRDARCQFDPESLSFQSPLIKNIQVHNGDDASEIEINLSSNATFDLHTDQSGIFIKFPIRRQYTSPVQPPSSETRETVQDTEPNRLVTLKDIHIEDKGDGHSRFELVLSGKAQYTLIPIETRPVRLAIDLKQTQARSLNKPVGFHNVKTVRGARNTSSVYRVVFDLIQMSNYTVKSSGNNLVIDFYQFGKPADPDPAPVPAVTPSPSAESPEPKEVSPDKEESTEALDTEQTQPPVLKLSDNPQKKEAPQTVQNSKEFFGPEKAKASQEKAQPEISPVTLQDDQGNEETYTTQSISGVREYSGEPYDFNFKDTDLVDVLKFIARVAGLNIAIDPGVTGKVTCEFVQVPWDQAMDIFLKINQLDYILDGNVLRIGTVTQLAEEARQRWVLKQAREQEEALEVVVRTLSFAKADAVKPILDGQLTARGEIIVDKRTNTLIISEIPDRIKTLDKLINTLDAPNRQVQIEARIVEAQTDYLNSFGVQWGYNFTASPAFGNQTRMIFPNNIYSGGWVPEGQAPNVYKVNGMENGFAINIPSPDTVAYPFLRLGNLFGNFNLDLALSGMERNGKGRIISSPKLSTHNNTKASVEQGERIPVQTIQNNTYTTVYIPATMKLEVTPQITAKGSVILDVLLNNDYAEFEKVVNGIPAIATEEIKTIIMINDGGTVVIGGMYKLIQSKVTTGVPGLSKIPFLGSLFQNRRKSVEQRELLIFLTPRIIK